MKTLAEAWASYESALLATAGETQRRETRRAFYAGAQVLFYLAVEEAGADDLTDDKGADMMERWHQELQQFAGDVKAGRA
jgi:hypothetical protein